MRGSNTVEEALKAIHRLIEADFGLVRLPETLAPAILIDRLGNRQLYADRRGRTLRLSPGVVTGQECVARLFETLGAELKTVR